jgi:transmembrane sensor
MEITKQQVMLFLANKLSAAEAKQVADYIADNPTILDELFSEQEWEQFETNEHVPVAIDQEMFAIIQKEKNKGIVKMSLKSWMRVAAALVLCLAGWLLYRQMSNATAPAKIVSQLPAKNIHREVVLSNTSNKKVRYVLEDSSVIILSKNSTVKYNTPFEAYKRDLQLTGKALFKVAKDKHRPFTVFAKGFSTTALGTAFTIKAYDTDKIANVKLFTGRIVVKNLHQSNNALYMAPGEQCSFDYTAVNLARVIPKQPRTDLIQRKQVPAITSGSIEETAEQITFKNTNLIAVMRKLSEVYRVRITYDSAAIKNKKFIGTIARERTLEDVLNTITLLNDLQFTKKDEEYIITTNQ